MANRTYLCCSSSRRTNPSGAASYRPARDTIAAATYALPLLWLALFEPSDIRADGAPIATKRAAIARLAAAVPRIEKAKLGSFAAEAALLAAALRDAPGTFITIELDELAMMETPAARFHARVRRAIAYLAGAPEASPARLLRSIADVVRPLGGSHIRAVPWEVAAPAKRVRTVSPEAALEAALRDGDERQARAQIRAGGVDLNKRRRGCDPPMQLVIYGKVRRGFAKTLVDAGYDLAKRHGGYAALHRAVWADNVEMVRELIRLGASVRAKDEFRRSPLALAAQNGALRSLEVLVRTGLAGGDVADAIRTAEKRLDKVADPAPILAAVARLRRLG